ncbi:hypothetical protein [Umezakia ovalisporum]|uniref:Uncharacterized protein n=1 Tax=Umezakia ovalisporum FSS-62 TaxID=2971776 RepID=A0AA43H1G1_9CYAN|nr:hypothetical protein [Umezakia ovalisporum]MDH6065045.1 hypothetical protein [Umezakia ovalisporum FSS-62]MDH6067172.1 hypothetical protein [Umezakia ovalisporum APH033B]MDH6075012.1 hypothetical protein [Umezakia ovalisporum CS-1034]MDH6076585.1 hypothetical protein [Umezakia ovalisporum FSS-45]MDH6082969.1 hypothetical protein [Umezakia ovalisporum FSS-44]
MASKLILQERLLATYSTIHLLNQAMSDIEFKLQSAHLFHIHNSPHHEYSGDSAQ